MNPDVFVKSNGVWVSMSAQPGGQGESGQNGTNGSPSVLGRKLQRFPSTNSASLSITPTKIGSRIFIRVFGFIIDHDCIESTGLAFIKDGQRNVYLNDVPAPNGYVVYVYDDTGQCPLQSGHISLEGFDPLPTSNLNPRTYNLTVTQGTWQYIGLDLEEVDI